MGCGASKIVPYYDERLFSKVAPVQDFSLIDVSEKSLVPGVSVNSTTSAANPRPPPTSRTIQPTTPALPPPVVVGGDLVDLEQSELMMPKKSWHATRLQGPPGVPLPPDRQRHEEYLEELNDFRRYVQRHPSVVLMEVQLKRGRVGPR